MNRFVGLAVGATLMLASQAYSCCLFCCCSKGNVAPAPVAVSAAPAAPPVTYVEQKVTTYKVEEKTRKVEVTVYKEKIVDQPYEYTVMQPTTRTEKRPVVQCKEEMVDQPY